MGGESPKPANTPTGAVFLSYASQDSEAAQRICEALRASGIEVWFDQSELRGGDAWDQSIRKQIRTCALFLPVISRTTHDRREGYFRLEWKLAIDRCHLMDANLTFLLPVVIDETRDDDERVPERFREVQWTRLPGGVTQADFVERVGRLLSGEPAQEPTGTASAAARVPAAATTPKPVLVSWRSKATLLTTIAVVVVALGYFVANRLALSTRGAEVAPATAFAPPPHSIAVLPFVNMSGDKDQEYFSEGLTEELLNSLARISQLQVAARTSSFSFQGEHPDIATVARKLNVGAVLEGSVRRSAHTVRITTQLVNGVTGFHLWSETYDRDLGDVLKLQTEIATAVASALEVTMLGDAAAKIEVGGTRNPAALEAYFRGWLTFYAATKPGDYQPAIDLHSQAIKLDPNYALAFAARSDALANYALSLVTYANPKTLTSSLAARDSALRQALEDAHKATALAPTMGEGYSALGLASTNTLEFQAAHEAMERALALAPGNARVLRLYGFTMAPLGGVDAAIATGRQALLLDPLNVESIYNLSGALYYGRQYAEALATLQKVAADPGWGEIDTNRGSIYYAMGNYAGARASCERDTSDILNLTCLAITYHKLGRESDAQAVLKQMQARSGDAALYQYARIYAQWGNGAKALECLNSALRLRDADLLYLKLDPLLDPIRNEPRFQAIERELKFPG